MIFWALLCAALFFIFGYLIKAALDHKQIRLEEEYYYQLKHFNLFSTKHNGIIKKKPKLFLLNNRNVLVSTNVSAALQEIFDFIIINYINSWYLGFSNNEDFVVEIKYFFHVLCSEILNRVSKVDIISVIRKKMLPIIVSHIDICSNLRETVSVGNSTSNQFQEAVLQRLRPHLHVSSITRAEEVHYLRGISKFLIPHLTPDYVSLSDNKASFILLQECLVSCILLPGMDAIASPDLINKFICLVLEPSKTNSSMEYSASSNVPILHRYQQAWKDKLNSKKIGSKSRECFLERFLRNEKYFYNFFQYVKSVDGLSPLTIFRHMDSITMNLINPDIDRTTRLHIFEDLHFLENLLKTVDDYDELNISPELRQRVKQVLEDGCENVCQLRNCSIWIENYNKLCQNLEMLYLTQYFESEFYLSSLYGDREANVSLDMKEKRKEFYYSKFGSSLSKTIKNDDFVDSITGEIETSEIPTNNFDYKKDLLTSVMQLPDLSTLRVKIPSIAQLKMDRNELYFKILTYGVDSDKLIFKVHRKYGEFYVLEQKLSEFHGNIGRSLPSKRPWDSKKLDFLDRSKIEFETFLMFLISRPVLKNSQLLYSFLSEDDIEFNPNNIMDINFGRLVKSVPIKLAKEKGQFLEQFLSNFHKSCENVGSSRSQSFDSLQISENIKPPQELPINSIIETRIHTKMFWNNAGLFSIGSDSVANNPCFLPSRFLFSFYDIICYLADIISKHFRNFHIIQAILYRLRTILMSPCDIFMSNIIERGIQKACQEKNLVGIIHLLRDTVLITGITSTSAEKMGRYERAQNCFRRFVPDFLKFLLPDDTIQTIYQEFDSVLEILQQPKLNKQLSYVLLDIVLLELFPEINNSNNLSKQIQNN